MKHVRKTPTKRKPYPLPEIIVRDTEDRWNNDSEDEFLWWPRVQWIDPGVTSGVAILWFDPKAVFEGKTSSKCVLAYAELFLNGPELGMNGQANRFLRIRNKLSHEQGLAVGSESFDNRVANRDPDYLSPVRIRAAIEFGLSLTKPTGRSEIGQGVPLHVQSPSDAMNAFTNNRLQALNMYRPGPDHVNDAKRHALLWIRKLPNRGMDFFKAAHGYEEAWFE